MLSNSKSYIDRININNIPLQVGLSRDHNPVIKQCLTLSPTSKNPGLQLYTVFAPSDMIYVPSPTKLRFLYSTVP